MLMKCILDSIKFALKPIFTVLLKIINKIIENDLLFARFIV